MVPGSNPDSAMLSCGAEVSTPSIGITSSGVAVVMKPANIGRDALPFKFRVVVLVQQEHAHERRGDEWHAAHLPWPGAFEDVQHL